MIKYIVHNKKTKIDLGMFDTKLSALKHMKIYIEHLKLITDVNKDDYVIRDFKWKK